MKRNIDLHGPAVTPSQQASRLRGLEGRYEMNKQLIGWLRTYQRVADLLLREYEASRAYPECCATFQKSKAVASQQGVALVAVQKALQREIDELRGQLPMFKEDVPDADQTE